MKTIIRSIDTTDTTIFVYGIPEMPKPTVLGRICLANHIKKRTGWPVQPNQINYITGKVWDEIRKCFQPGRGAHISVSGIVTVADINTINAAKSTSYDMYPLTYALSKDKQLYALSNHIQSQPSLPNCKNITQHSKNAQFQPKQSTQVYIIPQRRTHIY